MWQAPYRPKGEVSQTFNSGMLRVYAVTDEAEPGYQPAPKLSLRVKLPYEERRLGLQRYYEGKQNQIEVERVLRVPRTQCVSTQDTAVTEDGTQYRIDLVQTVADVFPPSQDLTLCRIAQLHELAGAELPGSGSGEGAGP